LSDKKWKILLNVIASYETPNFEVTGKLKTISEPFGPIGEDDCRIKIENGSAICLSTEKLNRFIPGKIGLGMNFERRAFLELRHKIGQHVSVNGQINTKGQATFLIESKLIDLSNVFGKPKSKLGLTYLNSYFEPKSLVRANLVSSLSQAPFASGMMARQGSILPNADSKSLHSHELDQTLPEGFLSLPPGPESHELDQTLPEGFLSLPLKPDLSLPSDNSDNFMSACDTFMSADKLDLTVSTTRVNRSSPSGSTEDNSIECFPAAHTQIKNHSAANIGNGS
jgi:hypothetical protein